MGCKFSLWKNDRNLEETGVVIDCDLVKELLQKGTAARNEANLIVAFNKDKTKAFLNYERASE